MQSNEPVCSQHPRENDTAVSTQFAAAGGLLGKVCVVFQAHPLELFHSGRQFSPGEKIRNFLKPLPLSKCFCALLELRSRFHDDPGVPATRVGAGLASARQESAASATASTTEAEMPKWSGVRACSNLATRAVQPVWWLAPMPRQRGRASCLDIKLE